MAIVLNFIDGEFVETQSNDSKATLELSPSSSGGIAKLTFSGEAGLISRRTASRQAENICRSGFLLKSGERVGNGMQLEIIEGDKLSEAHTRVGHKYNRY
ncbi:MAG: hypothetical protein HeimC2_04980 [Candidatus Heimdallarchaeota archaeon LC_2]|nr:MAG: hypothetical protein HeimC2_04980 [Candidatus Heimdallarchaeota archaeon LC_2]